MVKFNPANNLELGSTKYSLINYSDTTQALFFSHTKICDSALHFEGNFLPSHTTFCLAFDSLADSLIMKSYYSGSVTADSVYNGWTQPYVIKMDSCWKFDYDQNIFVPLSFSMDTSNILWQIQIVNNLVYCNINSSFLAKIDLGETDVYTNTPDNNGQDKKELIYPNPASDYISITTPGVVDIYNMNGKKVLENSSFSSKLNISELPPGIYMIKITTKNQIFTKKLIKI